MTDEGVPRDAAWVTLETPFTPEQLNVFIADTERLFRINSLLEINHWETVHPDRISLKARNLSNGKILHTLLDREQTQDGIRISYSNGLKRSTTLRVKTESEQTQLEILDDYSGIPEEERHARLDEVDKSLVQWGNDLHRYMRAWQRWSWFAPWRWYMTRVWQNMKPSARRIARWLIWITAAEFVAFLMVFTIFRLELKL